MYAHHCEPSTTLISLCPSEVAITPVYCCIYSYYQACRPFLTVRKVAMVLSRAWAVRCAVVEGPLADIKLTLLYVILIDKRLLLGPELIALNLPPIAVMSAPQSTDTSEELPTKVCAQTYR